MAGDTLDVALYDLLVYPPGVVHRETLDPGSRQEIVCLWLELGGGAGLPFSFKLSDDEGELGWLCQSAHRNHLRRGEHFRELEEHLFRSLLLFMEQKLALAAQIRNPALALQDRAFQAQAPKLWVLLIWTRAALTSSSESILPYRR